jgi:hypothetical protein
MEHTATYSPEDNKLRLYAAHRLDAEEYAKVKAAGFKWAPKQELFVAPKWTPEREDLLLEMCGEIGDEDYSPVERAADRAERFSGYRDKRRDEAHSHADTYDAGPSAFGHQNRARAERQAARHDRHRGRAVSQWSKAEYWQARTAGVISHALFKSSPAVRRGRILTIEADQRRHEKGREEYAKRFAAWQKVLTLDGLDTPVQQHENAYGITSDTPPAGKLAYMLVNSGTCWGQYKHPRTGYESSLYSLMVAGDDPITPREAASLWLDGRGEPGGPSRWSDHYTLRLTYERAMIEAEGGSAAAADMEPGGWICASTRTGSVFTGVAGGWMQIHGVNKSPATGRVTSVKVMGTRGYSNPKPGLVSINIERLGEGNYRAPTDEEREAFKVSQVAAKKERKATTPKAPPLINPTDADAERLQAIWNEQARERHARNNRFGSELAPSEVRRLTQAEYSQHSKGAHSHYETVNISEQLRERHTSPMGSARAGRVTVFKIRKAPGASDGFHKADRVVIITDKPRKAIPWEAVGDAADLQPSIEKLTPQLPEIFAACSTGWLPSEGAERQLIDDAEYIGWAYVSSMSQFGLTPAGQAAYAEFAAKQTEPVPAGQLF